MKLWMVVGKNTVPLSNIEDLLSQLCQQIMAHLSLVDSELIIPMNFFQMNPLNGKLEKPKFLEALVEGVQLLSGQSQKSGSLEVVTTREEFFHSI